eukprot:3672205-Pyramimonas_sp.AAC.1
MCTFGKREAPAPFRQARANNMTSIYGSFCASNGHFRQAQGWSKVEGSSPKSPRRLARRLDLPAAKRGALRP